MEVRTPAGRLSVACLVALCLAVLHPAAPRATSPNLVISQIYGGGGIFGALRTHDYVEIFNRGTAPVSLDGYSLQYASSSNTDLFGNSAAVLTELPAFTLQPGQYFLVQQASSGAVGSPLPTPDYVDPTPINMFFSSGKVALVLGDASLGCNGGSTPCSSEAVARIVDLVGYGTVADFYEGSNPALNLSNALAAFREDFGCTDTDDNGADFTRAAPSPRNTASPLNTCEGALTLSVADVSLNEGDTGTTTATFTVSLSAPAPAGGVTFAIATANGTATTAGGDYLAHSLSGQVIPEGEQTYSFDVTINGDLDVEEDETFTVQVTAITGADGGDTSAEGTIVNDDVLTTPIHVVQGNGFESPLLGQRVAVRGVVTALKINGFFMQTPVATPSLEDGDPATSEGIYVFAGGPVTAAVGDLVLAEGTVTAFFDLTQISVLPGGRVTKISSGNALPDPVTLTPAILAANGAATQLERLEAMLVAAASVTSVAPTNEFAEIHTVLNGVARPMREIGIERGLHVPNDPVTGQPDCCIPEWDGNPERLVIDTDGLLGAQPLWVTSKVTLSNVAGPLDYTFGEYKVLASPVAGPNMTVVPVPDPSPNEFTIAGYNITFFSALEPQLSKAALHIRDVMKYPDVIGMAEIASLAALQALANRVNSDAAVNPGYVAYLIPFGGGSQHVGFLVKSSRVFVESVSQEQTDDTFIDPTSGEPATTHDRPPLVLTATIDPNGVNPGRVIVVVNHLRSFMDIDLPGGVGPGVRAQRTAQAESIARLLQALQQNNANVPVISVGDYNAFEFSDGYTDPMSVIAGTPTPGDQIVVPGSADLVNPDYTNLTSKLPAGERYSFIFEGTPQALDHVVVNAVAHAYFQRYAVARSNADFPNDGRAGLRQNAGIPDAHSDHDSPVAYFAFPGTPVVTLLGDPSPDVEAFTSFTDPGATAHDDVGTLPVSVAGAVDVNVPGTYVLRYTASNLYATTVVERTVTVADTIAPNIANFAVTPNRFWPPNNQMFNVAASYSVTDASGSASCALSVTSNEPPNAPGNQGADWIVLSPTQLQLRAEQAVAGGTRVYTVRVTCTDSSGNAAAKTATVTIAR